MTKVKKSAKRRPRKPPSAVTATQVRKIVRCEIDGAVRVVLGALLQQNATPNRLDSTWVDLASRRESILGMVLRIGSGSSEKAGDESK